MKYFEVLGVSLAKNIRLWCCSGSRSGSRNF